MHFISEDIISNNFIYLGHSPKSLPVSSHTQNAQTCQHKWLNDLNSEPQHTDCGHATKQITATQWRHSSSCLRPSETYSTLGPIFKFNREKKPACDSVNYTARICVKKDFIGVYKDYKDYKEFIIVYAGFICVREIFWKFNKKCAEKRWKMLKLRKKFSERRWF